MDIEMGDIEALAPDAIRDGELGAIETCAVCETQPATGVTGLCTWCRPQIAGVVGEMQA